MQNSQAFRNDVAARLKAVSHQVPALTAFVGLDGFVDEIFHVVDKRIDFENFTEIPTIKDYGERLVEAAGKSTNVEFVRNAHISPNPKLGGNGPIMANALASFGLQVAYLGNLGYPNLHPVFADFASRAEVHSIAEPGYTDAIEFSDGKIMQGKHESLREINWATIGERFGHDKFAAKLNTSSLVAFVNWTMLPFMSGIWESIHSELFPALNGAKRRIFFDLADPEKRLDKDIERALELIVKFQDKFDVILGLNEKEAYEIAKVLGLPSKATDWQGLADLSVQIQKHVPVETLVVHPVAFALAVSAGQADVVEGPVCKKPKITTGAGDHFNSGFCLGKLLGLDNAASVLCGVSTSGHYVRNAQSPKVSDLAALMTLWPTQ
jgi:hypothetical protein